MNFISLKDGIDLGTPAGRSIASMDPLGNRTSTSYDVAGRTIASINPLGLRTSTNYDPAGKIKVLVWRPDRQGPDGLVRRACGAEGDFVSLKDGIDLSTPI